MITFEDNPGLVNDTCLTVAEAAARLEGGRKLSWGPVEVVVEPFFVDTAREFWATVEVCDRERVRKRVKKALDRAVRKITAGRGKKTVFDDFVNNLCLYNVSMDS